MTQGILPLDKLDAAGEQQNEGRLKLVTLTNLQENIQSQGMEQDFTMAL